MQEATFSEIEVIKDEGTQRDAVSRTDVAQQTEEDLPSMLESFQERNKELQEKLLGISKIEEMILPLNCTLGWVA